MEKTGQCRNFQNILTFTQTHELMQDFNKNTERIKMPCNIPTNRSKIVKIRLQSDFSFKYHKLSKQSCQSRQSHLTAASRLLFMKRLRSQIYIIDIRKSRTTIHALLNSILLQKLIIPIVIGFTRNLSSYWDELLTLLRAFIYYQQLNNI